MIFLLLVRPVSVPRVIVRNLDKRGVREGDKEEIRGKFRRFGQVTNVWMADDPPGFAYVFFEVFDDAIKAVESMNNTHLCGRRITVELSPSEDKRRNRGGWANRFTGEGEGEGDGCRGGDRGGGGGWKDNYRPRGRGGYRSYDRDDNRDEGRGGRDYDNRGQQSDYRDSYGGRGRGRGGYRGGGYGSRGRGGGYQQRWGGRGGYGSRGRDDGGYRSHGGFNRDRSSAGDSYNSDRGSSGKYHSGGSGGGSGSKSRGGYYERDSYDRRSRRDDENFSDDGGHSRSKDYDYRESRSYASGGDHHKGQDHGRQKRYIASSSPEYVKDSQDRGSKYHKRGGDGDEFQRRSSSDYHRRGSQGPESTKWEASPYRQQGGSPENFTRSRSHSRSPYTAPEYFSPHQDTYRSSRKPIEKTSSSYEHLDEFPAMDEAYSSSRSFDRRAEYSPEPAEPVSTEFSDYRDRDRMVKYGDLPESRSSRHYKSSKRSGSEEPLDHKVHDMESGGRYIKLDEKSLRSRGHERSHPRSYTTSHEPSDRHSSPPPPPPPAHSKRSVVCLLCCGGVSISNLIGAHPQSGSRVPTAKLPVVSSGSGVNACV